MIRDPFELLIIFFGVILISLFLEKRFAFAKQVSPVLLILFLTAFLSNTGIITNQSTFYDRLAGLTVPFAVCLLLFQVKLSDLKKAGIPMLVAFAVACVGTIAGVLLAGMLLNPFLVDVMGQNSWKIAGPFTGTYIGGSLNFFAVWDGLKIGQPSLLAAANAIDNLTFFPLFAIWMLLPERLMPYYPVSRKWQKSELNHLDITNKKPVSFKVMDIVTLTLVALSIMYLSGWLTDGVISRYLPHFPTILLITTFALIIAQFKFISRLEGATELGNISFYLFFTTVGAMINIQKAIMVSPVLFLYVIIIIVTHMIIIYGVGRLLKMDVKILTMASVATKSGPPVVLALANVKGWKSLLLPGMAMGLLGYAIGNYFGFGAAYLLKFLLGI